ncbi:MAG TPA: aminotransferase class V-fold PLP-dependent enzyme [Anaerolineae bacterium]|nr:aminotransferase class V-fold PLP-dependent enzyme [Anaerolineae bacterium]
MCAQSRLVEKYPSYAATAKLDALRAAEYARLDANNHVYLDYTGGGLYAESQLRKHMALLRESVFGNPHSSNPTSQAMTDLVEHARRYILEFFNADPQEYCAIFTSNASGALKLVGESYPFASGDRYLLTFDNHNSVNGIREFARARGAQVTYVPVVLPDLRVDTDALLEELERPNLRGNNLFAFPAQSNFSGVQHPLEFVEWAHSRGWDVVLDAAAFTPTNRLDLAQVKPDFVSQSFYKLFGYPTGVGALIARRETLKKLRRPWFAGGTITVASVQGDKYYLTEGEAAFEDGTLNYLNIPAVEIGLKHIQSIGYDVIHERVMALAGYLLDNLLALKHASGEPLVRLYGPPDTCSRGATITVNFYNHEGRAIDHREIERRANAQNISLRTGCFCNPGGGEIALGITGTELAQCFRQPQYQSRFTVDDFRLCIDGKSNGAVRVSLGLVSNEQDVNRFLEFAGGLVQ